MIGPSKAKNELHLHAQDLLSLELILERALSASLNVDANNAERARKIIAVKEAIATIEKDLDEYLASSMKKENELIAQRSARMQELVDYKTELSQAYGVDFLGEGSVQYDDATGQIFTLWEGELVPVFRADPKAKKKR